MHLNTGTITATGSGSGVTVSSLEGYGPESKAVVAVSGTYTSPTVVVEKKLRGGSAWLPVAMQDEKTRAVSNGSASVTTDTTTSWRVDLAGAGAVRVYCSAGSGLTMAVEIATGAVEEFGGSVPAVYTAASGSQSFAGGIAFTGATTVNTVSIPDNLADALNVTEGSNSYLKVTTTNGSEGIAFGVPTTGPTAAEVVTTTNVITAAESGKTFFLNSATEFVSTLPAPAAGLRFTFIVTAAPSGASYTVVTNSSSNIIKGHVVTSEDAGGSADSETSGGDTVSFVDGKAVAGDRAEFWCDGTNWFVSAFCKTFDAITITTAS